MEKDSAEIFNPIKSVDFLYSKKCNIKCSHCITEAGPEENSKLELNKVLDFVEAMRDFNITNLGLTGGEPLLYLNEVIEILSASKKNKINSFIVSNGFWGATPERAEEMVSRLVSAGLTGLNVSTDEFHLKFISNNTLLNIFDKVRKHKALDFMLRIASTVNYSHLNFISDNLKYFDKIRPEEKPFSVFSQFVVPFGRASDNVSEEEYLSENHDLKRECRFLGRPAVNHDGRMFICCNYFEEDDVAFEVGNLNFDSPELMLRNYQESLFVFFQRIKGPYFIAELAKKYKLKKKFKTKRIMSRHVHICDYCKLTLSQYERKDINKMLEKELSKNTELQDLAEKELKKIKGQGIKKTAIQKVKPELIKHKSNHSGKGKTELVQTTV